MPDAGHRMTRCYVALGGNVGPVEQTFERALAELAAHPQIALGRTSSVYRTLPVGPDAGGEFLNAAVELETALEPLDLLDLLKAVEDRQGRVRAGRWTPRTLDLDLLLYGDRVIDLPRLRVPHPACWYRRFVLDPLVEIAGDVTHPERGVSIAELRNRLRRRPFQVALAGGDPGRRRALREQLAGEFPEAALSEWHGAAAPADPVLLCWLGADHRHPRPAAQPTLGFEDLPQIARLDASQAADPAEFIRDVLSAAGLR